ncbi:MAG: DNA-binding protein [Alphaproteobacteria bacterium]|nr:MAG: DNA-binding protein [Alphaproteobacteria bacterium]
MTDKPFKIPPDLFLNGEIDWEKSELKNKKLEFEGIRLLQDINPIIDIQPEYIENTGKSNNPEKFKNNILPLNKSKKLEKPKKPDFKNPDLHINEKDAAEFLGISHRTLQGMRYKGDGPEYVKLKKAIRYKIAELNKWAQSNKKRNTSE